jgi:hypothetical protein
MRHWSFMRRRPADSPPATAGEETVEAQTHVLGTVQSVGWDTAPRLDDAWRELHPMPLNLEVDDGLSIPVLVDTHNANLILEATQKMREYREREKSSLPPVANFGSDPFSGGSDW